MFPVAQNRFEQRDVSSHAACRRSYAVNGMESCIGRSAIEMSATKSISRVFPNIAIIYTNVHT
jgi:hypothetical protein